MKETPEDRLSRGEATELDLLIIVKRLGEDLLESRDALDALAKTSDWYSECLCRALRGHPVNGFGEARAGFVEALDDAQAILAEDASAATNQEERSS